VAVARSSSNAVESAACIQVGHARKGEGIEAFAGSRLICRSTRSGDCAEKNSRQGEPNRAHPRGEDADNISKRPMSLQVINFASR